MGSGLNGMPWETRGWHKIVIWLHNYCSYPLSAPHVSGNGSGQVPIRSWKRLVSLLAGGSRQLCVCEKKVQLKCWKRQRERETDRHFCEWADILEVVGSFSFSIRSDMSNKSASLWECLFSSLMFFLNICK